MNTCQLCHPENETVLWRDERCRVILVDDADYPGFCRVIWGGHVKEMTDLPEAERVHFMRVVFAVEATLRELMRPDKINLASLGNMTPHVHWHVVPRFRDDRHFPAPIWAAPRRETATTASPRTMMSPPLPPSPPSGPPNSMNFSRRKLTAPGPPAPERMKIFAWSRKCMADAYALSRSQETPLPGRDGEGGWVEAGKGLPSLAPGRQRGSPRTGTPGVKAVPQA